MAFELTSPAFEDSEMIPVDFTCDGENINPPLEIHDIPDDTETMVLIVEDIDSDRGAFTHWMVWNIPGNTKFIDSEELPEEAEEGYNDFENLEYGGPCPRTGEHRYQFKLYAIDTELDLPEDVTKRQLEQAIAGHILDDSTLTGIYKR